MVLGATRDGWSSAELPLLSPPPAAAPGAVPAGSPWCWTNLHGPELTLHSARVGQAQGIHLNVRHLERASRSSGNVPSLLCDMSTD